MRFRVGLARDVIHFSRTFTLNPDALHRFNLGGRGSLLKNIRNALLVASALTAMLLAYYLLSGQFSEIDGLWANGVAMFFGIFGYLLFAGRKPRGKHHKSGQHYR